MSAEGPSMKSSDGHRSPLQKTVLGTRGSELARTQARMVADRLHAQWEDLTIETNIIRTMGDESDRKTKSLDRRAGRKGLFTAAIERALLAHEVDLGVHSAKDLPSELSQGVEIAAVLPRGLVNDVLVAKRLRRARQLRRAACEENIRSIGNILTWRLSISEATSRRVCASSPRTIGMRSCSPGPGWSGLVFRWREAK